MASFADHQNINQEICRILGVDAKYVTNITLEFKAGDVARVHISRLMLINEELEIRKAITEGYNLIQKPDYRGYVPEKGGE